MKYFIVGCTVYVTGAAITTAWLYAKGIFGQLLKDFLAEEMALPRFMLSAAVIYGAIAWPLMVYYRFTANRRKRSA